MGDLEHDFTEFRDTGSTPAMARVFDRAAPELLLVAAHLTRQATGAEDLVQSTLLAAIEQRAQFDASRRLMPWLLGILVNLHRSDLRRPRHPAVPESWPAKGIDPASAAGEAELVERLERLLSELPDSYREPLRLRLLHGLEPVQIAHALGRPLETVRTQLRRGKQHLREHLPASLAGAFALDMGLGRDSLNAMRSAVLAHAESVSVATVSSSVVGGLLVMKKWIAVAAAVVFAAGGVFLTRQHHPEAETPAAAVPPQELRTPSESLVEARLTAQDTSDRVAMAREDTAPVTTLECKVRWASDGSLAGGVRMRLFSAGSSEFSRDPEAVTDDQGEVRFEAVSPGPAWLQCDRGGTSSFVINQGQHNETEFEIPQGVLVQGTVVDHLERPVEGATLWLSDRVITMGSVMDCGVSGPGGLFEVRDVEPHRVLGARLQGLDPSDGWAVLGDAGDVVETTLQLGKPAGRLRGIVRGPDGTPRRDAVLVVGHVLHYLRYAEDGATGIKPPQWVYPDSDGVFEVEVPLDFEFPIWARTSDTAIWRRDFRFVQADNQIEIDLPAGAVVKGKVLDGEGSPIPGAAVTTIQEGIGVGPGYGVFLGPSMAVPTTKADAVGEFELTNVLPGLTTILAHTAGRKQTVTAKLQLTAGSVATCDLVMGTEKRIVGIVVDEHDQPVAGVVVTGVSEDNERKRLNRVTTTASGEFVLLDAWKDTYTISATEPEVGVNPHVEAFGVVPGGEPVRLEYSATSLARSRILGTLIDAGGAPVTESGVWLDRIGSDGRCQWGGDLIKLEEGRFSTKPLPTGTYILTYRAHYSGLEWEHAVDLGASQELDLGVIEIPSPGRIELICEGDVRPEMSARIHKDLLPWAIGLELEDGRGLSGPLQPGEYRVGFSGMDGHPLLSAAAEVRAGETTTVHLALRPAVRRKVRIPLVLEDGVLLTQTWFGSDGQIVSKLCWGVQRRESDQSFEWFLLPGQYHVVVEAVDGRRAETDVLVTDAPESDEVIELPSPVLK